MKILYAIAALALAVDVGAGPGRSWNAATYSKFYGKVCTTTYLDDPPRNPAQEQEDEKARRASIESGKRSASRSAPMTTKASSAWFYARKGCEFGRSE